MSTQMPEHAFTKWNVHLERKGDWFVLPLCVINLKRCTERLERVCASVANANTLLHTHGYTLELHVFEAYDYRRPKQVTSQLVFPLTYTKGKHIRPAEVCCTLSHLACIHGTQQRDRDLGQQRPWLVCEDDIDITRLASHFERFVTDLQNTPAECGILQLVATTNPTHHIYGVETAVVPWKAHYFAACMYLVLPVARAVLQKKFMRESKWLIHDRRLSVADHVVYSSTRTFTTPFPYCSLQADESVIHPSHLKFHRQVMQQMDAFVESEAAKMSLVASGTTTEAGAGAHADTDADETGASVCSDKTCDDETTDMER